MINKLLSRILKINRLWLLFFLALVLGVTSAYLSSSYLKNREKDISEELKKQMSGGPTIEVLVSSRNLPMGALVGDTLVKRQVPMDLVEEDVLKANDFERIAGAKLTRPLRAGYPINTSYFVEKNRTFSEAVEPGMRAITIEVDEINSMAQMVKPGNRVDLMLIAPDKADPEGGVEVLMVLQNVKVMATGQSVAARENDARSKNPRAPSGGQQTYSNFTFEVTPQDAAIIALAQNTGKIRAVLRKLGDNEQVTLKDVNSRWLLNIDQKNAEKRKLVASTRMQEMSFEDNLRSSAAGKRPEIEYVIGGMGASAAVSMGQTLGATAAEQLTGGKPQVAQSSGSALRVDKLQNSVSEALRRSGVPADIAGGATAGSAK
jgi:pilus assembly protein CpaB